MDTTTNEENLSLKKIDLKFLKKISVNAIEAVQKAVKEGKRDFCLKWQQEQEKPCCGSNHKLFLRTGNAKRVLFLVDRLELENQA